MRISSQYLYAITHTSKCIHFQRYSASFEGVIGCSRVIFPNTKASGHAKLGAAQTDARRAALTVVQDVSIRDV